MLLTSLMLVAAAVAVWHWAALARGWRLVPATKVGFMVVLIGAAAAGSGDAWMLVGLVCCLAGDAALLSDEEPWFVAGLGAFLLGLLAYAVAFTRWGSSTPSWWWLSLVLVVVLVGVAGLRVLRGAASQDRVLGACVAAYMLALSTMTVTGYRTGALGVAAGATLFMLSDLLLGWDRFVRPIRSGRLLVMVTYQAAQWLIVLALLRAHGHLGG